MKKGSFTKTFLRIFIPVSILFIVFIILQIFLRYNTFKAIYGKIQSHTYSTVLDSIKDELKTSVYMVVDLIQEQKVERMSKEELKRFLGSLKNVSVISKGTKYGNYFFIVDFEKGQMVLHPVKEYEENPEVFKELKDLKTGKKIWDIFKEAVNNPDKEGFVIYNWYKPEEPEKVVTKVSFVKLCKNTNWLVGSGAYIDILNTIAKEKAETLSSYLLENFKYELFFSILMLVIILIGLYSTVKPVINNIDKIKKDIDYVASNVGKEIKEIRDMETSEEMKEMYESINGLLTKVKENYVNVEILKSKLKTFDSYIRELYRLAIDYNARTEKTCKDMEEYLQKIHQTLELTFRIFEEMKVINTKLSEMFSKIEGAEKALEEGQDKAFITNVLGELKDALKAVYSLYDNTYMLSKDMRLTLRKDIEEMEAILKGSSSQIYMLSTQILTTLEKMFVELPKIINK